MSTEDQQESEYYREQAFISRLVSHISTMVRTRIFESLMQELKLEPTTRVLDVGVTCDKRSDSNFFEIHYPFPNSLTAVGLEDASFLESELGIKFVQADALALPFADKSFDLAVSWAVIEHIGSRERQKRFIDELARVADKVFVTTPNRWYPIEFHTVMPLIHWLPANQFRSILRALGKNFYASEETLNLLSQKDLEQLFPNEWQLKMLNQKLFGFTSNLVVYATRPQTRV